MQLGAFSISIHVKNLATSKLFYEKLGFSVFSGNESMNYLIMKNGDTLIGLFQGMFDSNILTFNPGWDQNADPIASFDDIRSLQQQFEKNGLEIKSTTLNDNGTGNMSLIDPDGNVILIDQHVSAPSN